MLHMRLSKLLWKILWQLILWQLYADFRIILPNRKWDNRLS